MGKKERQRKWRIRKRIQRKFPTAGKACELCESTKRLERHHIDFNYKNNRVRNIAIICKSCHREIHRSKGIPILSNA